MMGSYTSSEVRLRGKYVQPAPDGIQHMSLLQNKLPLTKPKKNTMVYQWQLHLNFITNLGRNYSKIILRTKFQDKKKKSSAQYIL